MSTETIQLDCGARRMAALAWGDAAGTPVLALHGWLDHAGSFAALAPRLNGCRTVAVDLPGHGDTPLDPGGDCHQFLDGVVAIHQALDALGWERAHLLGHSMGAALALLFGAAFPQRVRTLISIDMLGPITDAPGDFPQRLARAVFARLSYRESRRFFSSRDEAIAARERPDLSRPGAEILAERGLEQTAEGWTWRGDRRLKLPSLARLTEDQVLAAVRAAEFPVLVIRAEGERGPALEAMFERRLEKLPHASFQRLPGGHHLHLENPEPCAATILDFLRRG